MSQPTERPAGIVSGEKPYPLRAIRLACLACCCDNDADVRACTGTLLYEAPCTLHEYRMGKAPAKKRRPPLKAIRAYCLACMGGSAYEVGQCPSEFTCVLWPYRDGHNPSLRGKGSSSEHLARIRGNERGLGKSGAVAAE